MMNKFFIVLFSIYAFSNPALAKSSKVEKGVSCASNQLNLLALFLNNENYYKYLYALSMARVGVDGELIRRSVEVEEKEVLDPGSPQLKKMLEQQLVLIESILINSGCSQKEAIRFKYQLIKEAKKSISNKEKKKDKK